MSGCLLFSYNNNNIFLYINTAQTKIEWNSGTDGFICIVTKHKKKKILFFQN